jgi:hypothetical protein
LASRICGRMISLPVDIEPTVLSGLTRTARHPAKAAQAKHKATQALIDKHASKVKEKARARRNRGGKGRSHSFVIARWRLFSVC